MPRSKSKLVTTLQKDALCVLEFVGRDFEAGLVVAVQYLPAADAITELVFPPSVAVLTPVTIAVDLLQKSIVTVEQSYAARGQQHGTGTTKLATVVTLSSNAVQALLLDPDVANALHAHGITVDDATVTALTNDIVAVLNARQPSNPAVAKAA